MNHRRGRPKSARAGCLMCKANKISGHSKHSPWNFHRGFGKLRAELHAAAEQR